MTDPASQGEFKNGSRRRKEADFGAKNTYLSGGQASASSPRRLRLLRRFLNSTCQAPAGTQYLHLGESHFGVVALLLCFLAAGCSIRKMAVNKLGDALAAGGTTFASDDDPELVKAAVPFSLKLMESLLAESPKHKGLLFATASGFTQYAYAFVQQEADEVEEENLTAATGARARALRLYLRARNYG